MLRFKCPYTGHIVAVNDESELPEGQVFQRITEDERRDVPAVPAIYAPLTWDQVTAVALRCLPIRR